MLNDLRISLNFKCRHILSNNIYIYIHVYIRKNEPKIELCCTTHCIFIKLEFFEPLLDVFCKKDLKNEPVF